MAVANIVSLRDTGAVGGASNDAGSLTAAAGSDRLLLYFSLSRASTDEIDGIDYGGEAMTQIGTVVVGGSGFPVRGKMWRLGEAGIDAAADNGFDIDTTDPNVGTFRAGAAMYSGVDQINPLLDNDTDTGSTDPGSISLTGVDDGFLCAVGSAREPGTFAWSGVTERYEANDSLLSHSGGDAVSTTAAGAVTVDPTFTPDGTASNTAVLMGVALRPAQVLKNISPSLDGVSGIAASIQAIKQMSPTIAAAGDIATSIEIAKLTTPTIAAIGELQTSIQVAKQIAATIAAAGDIQAQLQVSKEIAPTVAGISNIIALVERLALEEIFGSKAGSGKMELPDEFLNIPAIAELDDEDLEALIPILAAQMIDSLK